MVSLTKGRRAGYPSPDSLATGIPQSHGREGVMEGNSYPGPYLAFDSVTPCGGELALVFLQELSHPHFLARGNDLLL